MTSINQSKITLKNDEFQKLQRSWAIANLLIPFIGTIIAIVLACFWGISKIEVGLLVSMYGLTLLGITVGFHRLLAHGAFQTYPVVRVILAILGAMATQGTPIYWVSNHRRHHQYSDRSGDPHSPHVYGENSLNWLQGLWHSQVAWSFTGEVTNPTLFAKDLIRDPVIMKVNKLYLTWVILGLVIPAVLGGVLSRTWLGLLQGLLWGGMMRIFLVHHISSSINSITHLYGSRPFNTRNCSTNNIWLTIPTFGEAWHNNHHAFPNSAKFGLKWWQVDLGYWGIRVLEVVGLAWDVKNTTVEMLEAKEVV
ncbi:MAG: acyl-CoA desaturase [Xenococcaceae cyanobacterium]